MFAIIIAKRPSNEILVKHVCILFIYYTHTLIFNIKM